MKRSLYPEGLTNTGGIVLIAKFKFSVCQLFLDFINTNVFSFRLIGWGKIKRGVDIEPDERK